MTPLSLAMAYLDRIFGGDLDQLKHILADDLEFLGPMYHFLSASAYIAALKEDPPNGFHYEILKSYEDRSSACLIYRFSKPGVTTVMAQVFEVDQSKIKKIQLVFDTAMFGNPD